MGKRLLKTQAIPPISAVTPKRLIFGSGYRMMDRNAGDFFMAVIDPTYPKPRPSDVLYVLWSGLAAGDTGKPISVPQYNDKNLTVFGTFGGNGTMEGTDDPRGNPDHPSHASAAWVPITDTLDVSGISKSANGGEAILQNYAWIRPAAGAGVTSISFALTCKKGN